MKAASAADLPEGYWLTEAAVAVTLFYFPAESMKGDLDNIVKPILDALTQRIYVDDKQVERIVVQRFEPNNIFPFAAPSPMLEQAMSEPKPLIYVRVSTARSRS